ncbi:MAG: leucine-rich repeat protein [Ruminococcus sp.]
MRIWKRLLAMLSAGVIFAVSAPFAVGAEETAAETGTYGDLAYKVLNNGTVQITGFAEGAEGVTALEIPSEIDGMAVTRIDQFAFDSSSSIVSVTIPDSVSVIGAGAFQNCTSLTEIEIPDSVSLIPEWLFYNCTSLEKITLPETIRDMGGLVFYKTPWLEQQKAENDMVILDTFLIDACQCEGDAVIPEGVTKICAWSFYRSENEKSAVTSLTIPKSVAKISDGLNDFGCGEGKSNGYELARCKDLESISVVADNPYYQSKDGVLFSKDGTELLCYPRGKGGAYEIPAGVTELEDAEFSGCELLSSVTLPQGMTKIGQSAFSSCTSLVEVSIPDSVTEVEYGAFWDTAILEAQTGAAKYVDHWLIEFDSSVSELEILPGTVGIADGALHSVYVDDEESTAKYLRKLIIPDSVKYICDEMEGDQYYGYSFIDVSKLEEVSMSDTLKEQYLRLFVGSPWADAQVKTLDNGMKVIGDILVDASMCEGDVVVPDGITTIAGGAFSCYNPDNEEEMYKITSITFPDSVTRIESYAFIWCMGLEKINIPNHLQYLGSVWDYMAFAFSNPYQTTPHLELPDSLTEIELLGLAGAESVKFPDTMTELPSGIASGGGYVISSTYKASEVILPENLKIISAFSLAGNDFESITIPKTVTKIEWGAFADCTNLQDVYFEGTEEEWNAIDITWSGYWFFHNGPLSAAEIHFQDDPDAPDVTTTSTTAATTTTTSETTTTAKISTTGSSVETESTSTTQNTTDSTVLYGDVNLDGRVDITDSVLLNKAAAGAVKLSDQAADNADCDANGELGTDDAILLLKFLVHLINTLPCTEA